MPDFPVLDAPRLFATNELNRFIVSDSLAPIEPYIEEVDFWCSMPVRLVYDQANALHIEIGPYSLAHNDINRLRAAIAAYDQAVPAPKAQS